MEKNGGGTMGRIVGYCRPAVNQMKRLRVPCVGGVNDERWENKINQVTEWRATEAGEDVTDDRVDPGDQDTKILDHTVASKVDDGEDGSVLVVLVREKVMTMQGLKMEDWQVP